MSKHFPHRRKIAARVQAVVFTAFVLLTHVLLASVSIAGGNSLRGDPPPRPPKWLAEEFLGENPDTVFGGSLSGHERDHVGVSDTRFRHVSHPAAYGTHAAYEAKTPDLPPGPLQPIDPYPVDEHAVYPPHYGEAAPMEDLWELPQVFRPDEYERYRGEGEPLVGASWLNRPYYAGFLFGAWYGDTLIPGEVDQGIGFFFGARLGWDYDVYWGTEMRLAFSDVGLEFIDEPSVDGLSSDVLVWDLSLVYYPWGDARWRPFVGAGVGLVDFDFLTATGIRRSEAVFGIPLMAGLKYRQSDWITMRLDVTDNIAFGGRAGFETMNNISLAGGLEFRFGGTRKSYFPWNPSRTLR
jgi:outer membrane protein with beta-barrel domain